MSIMGTQETQTTPAVITGDEFHEALRAGKLDPRAREIADAITRATDDLDRIGGLYEYAYRAALAGLTRTPVAAPESESPVATDDDVARPYTQAEFVAAAVSARTYYNNPIVLVESVPQSPGFVGKVFVTVQDGATTRRTYTTFRQNMATYIAPRAFGA